MARAPVRILCVGESDTCRSPMLAALLSFKAAQNDVYAAVESVGITVGEGGRPADAHAITCMSEYTLDISGHTSRSIDVVNVGDFDIFICLDTFQQELLLEMGVDPSQIILADSNLVSRPAGDELTHYRACVRCMIPEVLRYVADLIES